ncbi:hypothetical protein HMPREF1556_01937 [Porphyromonas sp. oral taxon 278 str. W7784]|nr:hypothetical protein HMPREF1556_01937 [Porphyromonas sp. oral taxon 278 str. W7784]
MTHEYLPSETHEWGLKRRDDLGEGAWALVLGEGGGMESEKKKGGIPVTAGIPPLVYAWLGLGA